MSSRGHGDMDIHHGLEERLISLLHEREGHHSIDLRHRVVVIGGGTGLSTLLGGNSKYSNWAAQSDVGMKRSFEHLHAVVCTTDDGGSTGLLLRHFPFVGIGDIRKVCLSMIDVGTLAACYGLSDAGAHTLVSDVQRIINYRFTDPVDATVFHHPDVIAEHVLPGNLVHFLRSTMKWLTSEGIPILPLKDQCMGNLLLTACIYQDAGDFAQTPSAEALRAGISRFARAIGSRPGCIHGASAMPGQLFFRYEHGVEVCGQNKSGRSLRGFAVESICTGYAQKPEACSPVLELLESADMIVFAPGSIFSSILPVLQIPRVAGVIRKNRRALKVMIANFWIQEGETDISQLNPRRGFLVSELVRAFDHNVSGGISGIVDMVLCSDLSDLSGRVLRNYALENRVPIYLDREAVRAFGVVPLELPLLPEEHTDENMIIQNDPTRMSRAIQCLATQFFDNDPEGVERLRTADEIDVFPRKNTCTTRYAATIYQMKKEVEHCLQNKYWSHPALQPLMMEIWWQNRDVRAAHLAYFDGVQVVAESDWQRSVEWDNVLGYYDPADRMIYVHEAIIAQRDKLKGDLLIGLGESLLGNYIESRAWHLRSSSLKIYQVAMQPEVTRFGFFSRDVLNEYMLLAGMVPCDDPGFDYQLATNDDEGCLLSGLRFGLLFTWYLDSRLGMAMEYEMNMLRGGAGILLPHQARAVKRKQDLIHFFRHYVFGEPAACGC
ncbi:MAG: YvcK family protein [Spartobacteria bacterium]|nr:YvcK family protein [Spartobacteria bacterium]